MIHVSIGDVRYCILATERGGQWIARAERDDTGEPFGIECGGPTETRVIDRLTGWLEWQSAHTAALEALQQAERAYHRTIAGGAFANPTKGPTAVERQRESLGSSTLRESGSMKSARGNRSRATQFSTCA